MGVVKTMTGTDQEPGQQAPQGPAAIRSATASPAWTTRYIRWVAVGDFLVIVATLLLTHAARFDGFSASPQVVGLPTLSYMALVVIVAVVWMIALSLARTRHPRVIGAGSAEFQRVFRATWQVFACVAIGAYLLKAEVGRGFLILALPLGLVFLIVFRVAARTFLKSRRRHGTAFFRVVAVGNVAKITQLVRDLEASPEAGYKVVGACVVGDATAAKQVAGVPVLGTYEQIDRLAAKARAHVVAVTGSDAMTGDVVRRIGWQLEGTETDLVLVPALADIAGPRVLMSPVSGTHHIHVDEPLFTGPKYVLKNGIDRLGAFVIVVLISPVLLVIAALVKLTSRGPVFYRQERIGKDGQPFKMLKFRSMDPDADTRLAQVLRDAGHGEVGMFYKLKDDPRVTKVGKVLRRYSLDELPQLFNVLRGDMSLVGPRPQIDQEVALYDDMAYRRLRVLPGLTGLWQVSGRSELTPEESVRLDVYYVENWTPLGDVWILLKTVRAIFGAEGAY